MAPAVSDPHCRGSLRRVESSWNLADFVSVRCDYAPSPRRHNMRKGLMLGFVAQCLLYFFYVYFFSHLANVGAAVS